MVTDCVSERWRLRFTAGAQSFRVTVSGLTGLPYRVKTRVHFHRVRVQLKFLRCETEWYALMGASCCRYKACLVVSGSG